MTWGKDDENRSPLEKHQLLSSFISVFCCMQLRVRKERITVSVRGVHMGVSTPLLSLGATWKYFLPTSYPFTDALHHPDLLMKKLKQMGSLRELNARRSEIVAKLEARQFYLLLTQIQLGDTPSGGQDKGKTRALDHRSVHTRGGRSKSPYDHGGEGGHTSRARAAAGPSDHLDRFSTKIPTDGLVLPGELPEKNTNRRQHPHKKSKRGRGGQQENDWIQIPARVPPLDPPMSGVYAEACKSSLSSRLGFLLH